MHFNNSDNLKDGNLAKSHLERESKTSSEDMNQFHTNIRNSKMRSLHL